MDLFGLLAVNGVSSKYANVIPFGIIIFLSEGFITTPLTLIPDLCLTGSVMSLLPRSRDILYLRVHFPLSDKSLSLF